MGHFLRGSLDDGPLPVTHCLLCTPCYLSSFRQIAGTHSLALPTVSATLNHSFRRLWPRRVDFRINGVTRGFILSLFFASVVTSAFASLSLPECTSPECKPTCGTTRRDEQCRCALSPAIIVKPHFKHMAECK